MPRLTITSENSLTCARLIETTPAVRRSSRRSAQSGNTVSTRVASTTSAATKAMASVSFDGTGILRPSVTKKRVTKKSRTPDSRATTSMPYGKAARTSPAINAPISVERPTCPATPATRKHQATEVMSTSSCEVAMARNSVGST